MVERTPSQDQISQPIIAGLITTMVGFVASFAVVLAGLYQVGASPSQAASGLLALSVLVGLCTLVLSWRHRMPISIAWSTPGAAMLASLAPGAFSFEQAVGAFIVSGVLIILTGLLPGLHKLLTKIPVPIAQGMLAGVLLPLCIKPFTALGTITLPALGILLVFLIGLRVLPKFAVALSMLAAVCFGLWHIGVNDAWGQLQVLPHLEFVVPEFSLPAIVSISVPLFIVTMASQNIPGVAVLGSFGYELPWRPSMIFTGVGSAVGAFFGGHAINLAAITAALAAGEQAGANPKLRWRAGCSSGFFYLVFGALSALIVSLASASPEGLFQAAAGLALLATLTNALLGSMGDPSWRLGALVTVLVAAGNLTIFGIGGAFWALVAGLLTHFIAERSARR
ncbi:benzoate/H(+) symporter BenE family transporter [Glutamicibacter sp. JC586]|uniref:benzoate/H(+) symporter BenE family transporter n=1 Tax=Glutamicibacter sp. JC586 TaxID=2590552 RepID=UPI00135848E3|nr:benzoate/H(+) symporter BenE family transporter [Glutamicibacter sp. JC586]